MERDTATRPEQPVGSRARLFDLDGSYKRIGKTLVTVDGGLVLDGFQVHDIEVRNSFGLHSFPEAPKSSQ